ncbi:hypothetical protein Tco_1228746 [Tanacetum coccineum]
MVAFLEKPIECEGFKQILDFLNAHTIKYALTVNHIVYTSCIEQFWVTAKVKTVNEEKQLQALVDRKKVVIIKSTIRRDLQLEDAEGMDYLPTATIFEELTRMSMGKFWMYPRFVQVFLDQQVGDMSTHDEIYVTPSHTKKVFGNMKRVGKGFSGNITPLFPAMMVQAQEEVGEAPVAYETENEENVPTHSNDPLLSGEDSIKLNELIELCTKLQQRVLDSEHTKTTQALEIGSLKRRVKKLEKKQRSRTHKLKRLYKVGLSAKVISSDDEGLGDQEDASKQGRKIQDIDADEDITLENVNDVDMFGVHDLDGDEELKSTKPKAVTTAATTTTTAVTRPKAKGLVIQEQRLKRLLFKSGINTIHLLSK